jgi:hypothetical protein
LPLFCLFDYTDVFLITPIYFYLVTLYFLSLVIGHYCHSPLTFSLYPFI